MAQATWTTGSGSNYDTRTSAARIALPALDAMPDLERGTGAAARHCGQGLRRGIEDGLGGRRDRDVRASASGVERGWFRVKVRNPTDSVGVVLHTADGSPLVADPAEFRLTAI